MWGIDIYLARLGNSLARRKRSRRVSCDICNDKYERLEEMELHRRDAHPEASPRIADA
ncbi:MAG: hypothetical protein ABI361_07035 [Nitrososphaera sp.]|jgi:hypothetical protein